MFNGNLAPGGSLKVTQARRRQVRSAVIRLASSLGSRAKSRSKAALQSIPPEAGQKSVPVFVVPRLDTLAPAPELSRDGRSEQDSLFSMYVREVGQVALLTPAEEVALAARIQRGDAAAREHMIRANLRLVIKIAREYENLGMPLLDLINEGNVGLMKAVEKFDPAKGGKLSTYAALWIRQQIRRALASQGKTIRLPVHVADRIYHLSQAELRLRGQLGREATEEELAQELNTTVKRLEKLRRAAARPASLDAPLGDDASSTIAEVVADENAATPFEQLQHQTETALVRKLVANLPEREAQILRLRFGLDSGQEQTLETVGRKLKLTRERIRQVQNLALQKLRQMLETPQHFPLAT
jgi:RNA polymerase primary sigma factor